MTKIKITIEINSKKHIETTLEMETEKFNQINEICNYRKTGIESLIINDITEMTPDQAEEIISSWDM